MGRLTNISGKQAAKAFGKGPSATHRKPGYSLEELLKGVTRKNLHDEIGAGEAVGREAW